MMEEMVSNWYKTSSLLDTKDIGDHIAKSIMLLLPGHWDFLSSEEKKPSYRMQKYIMIKLQGKDVIKKSDYFFVKVGCYIYKGTNIKHPWDASYEGATDFSKPTKISPIESPEDEQNRFRAIDSLKPENASKYDSEYGHRLIKMWVTIYGFKTTLDEYQRIDNKDTDIYFDTPYEVANYVKNTINKFYFGGDENKDEPIAPVLPTNRKPEPVGAFS